MTYYSSLVKTLNKQLAPYHCKLFYVSVNPINSQVMARRGRLYGRSDYRILVFNLQVRKQLAGICTFIDTHSVLLREGFGFDGGMYGVNAGFDDGLHYTTNTYKRIYNIEINAVNAAK